MITVQYKLNKYQLDFSRIVGTESQSVKETVSDSTCLPGEGSRKGFPMKVMVKQKSEGNGSFR